MLLFTEPHSRVVGSIETTLRLYGPVSLGLS